MANKQCNVQFSLSVDKEGSQIELQTQISETGTRDSNFGG